MVYYGSPSCSPRKVPFEKISSYDPVWPCSARWTNLPSPRFRPMLGGMAVQWTLTSQLSYEKYSYHLCFVRDHTSWFNWDGKSGVFWKAQLMNQEGLSRSDQRISPASLLSSLGVITQRLQSFGSFEGSLEVLSNSWRHTKIIDSIRFRIRPLSKKMLGCKTRTMLGWPLR